MLLPIHLILLVALDIAVLQGRLTQVIKDLQRLQRWDEIMLGPSDQRWLPQDRVINRGLRHLI